MRETFCRSIIAVYYPELLFVNARRWAINLCFEPSEMLRYPKMSIVLSQYFTAETYANRDDARQIIISDCPILLVLIG